MVARGAPGGSASEDDRLGPVLVVADRLPRAGLRHEDHELVLLLDELRAGWPMAPVTVAAPEGAADEAEALADRGIEAAWGLLDWPEWLARRGHGFALVVLHGAITARRLAPLLRQTQPYAARLRFPRAGAGPELDGAPGPVALFDTLGHVPGPGGAPGFHGRSGLLAPASAVEGAGSPDEDALRFLVEEVLPLVRARSPGMTLDILAEDATPGLRRLEGPGVRLVGADETPADRLARVRAVVAARRLGPATPTPLLLAAEAGVPLVALPVTAERLGLPASLSAPDDAPRLAEALRRVCEEPSRWAAARAALERVRLARLDRARYRAVLVAALGSVGIAPPDPRGEARVGRAAPIRDRRRAVGRRWRVESSTSRTIRPLDLVFTDQVQTEGLRREDPPGQAPYERYHDWRLARRCGEEERRRAEREMAGFERMPLISIVTPVFNTEPRVLEAAIDSVRAQVYPRWQLCVADDASTWPDTIAVLHRAAAFDPRVRLLRRARNGGIVAASNDALALADGEFVALLDHDDELDPMALFEVVRLLNQCPDLDFIYSDEEKMDERGTLRDPAFKSSFSPDLLDAGNYICHLSVFRRSVLAAVDGFRDGFDGAQDFDLVLRVVERTTRIGHVAKPLYSWRMVSGSVAHDGDAKPYAFPAGRRALEDALRRRGYRGWVEELPMRGHYRIHYDIVGRPGVTIAIPAPADDERLESILDQVRHRTAYPDHRVVVIAPGRSGTARLARRRGVETIEVPDLGVAPLMNRLACDGRSDLVLVLDAGVGIVSEDWLDALVEHAQRPEIGAAGGELILLGGRRGSIPLFAPADDDEGWLGPPYLGAVAQNHRGVLHNVAAFTGDCLVLRPTILREVGGWDEAFADFELACIDLTLRIRQRGYDLLATPYAELTAPMDKPRIWRPQDVRRFHRRWGTDGSWPDPYQNPNYRASNLLLHFPDGPPRGAPARAGRRRR